MLITLFLAMVGGRWPLRTDSFEYLCRVESLDSFYILVDGQKTILLSFIELLASLVILVFCRGVVASD
jgi:hypothetical protein